MAIERLRTIRNVALQGDYDATVDPRKYHEHVLSPHSRRDIFARVIVQKFEQFMPRTEGETPRILDIAAGTGIISEALARQYDVTATDMSKEQLAYLQERNPSIETNVADMNEWFPFPDNSFSGVTTVWANRFMEDSVHFLRQAYRILEPNGVLVWPIFPTEGPLWKKNAGLIQATRTRSLGMEAKDVGFRSVRGQVLSLPEQIRQRTAPLHPMPNFLIARK